MAIQREVGSKKKSKRYVIFRPLFFSNVSGLFYFLFVIGSLSKKKKKWCGLGFNYLVENLVMAVQVLMCIRNNACFIFQYVIMLALFPNISQRVHKWLVGWEKEVKRENISVMLHDNPKSCF